MLRGERSFVLKLYLVQHGDAVPEQVDPARPLNEKGRRDVRELADFLAQGDVAVSRIVHSGKLRAQQTAEIIASRLSRGQSVAAIGGLDPKDDAAAAARSLARSRADTLAVSHMPLLGKLVSLLLAEKESPALVAFRPGTAVCLERGEAGPWAVSWVVRPGLVPRSADLR
jgi:phosphohistidine phosphatase